MDAVQVAQLWAGRAEPILPTASIERTLEFWVALGFTTRIWEDDEGYAWVYPGDNRDGISIDYSLTDRHDPFTGASMAYLAVADVDAIYEAITATGVIPQALEADGLPSMTAIQLRDQWQFGASLARVTRPIDQIWGKRELALFDPDNNLIRIGSALPH